jgi:hypothetical protein
MSFAQVTFGHKAVNGLEAVHGPEAVTKIEDVNWARGRYLIGPEAVNGLGQRPLMDWARGR